MQKFFLIDGNAYIHRAYHALPPLLTSTGEQVNAIYGFLRMLLKIIKNEKPDYLAICFDFPGKTFRHNFFSDYKATRKEIDDELKSQIPIAKDLVKTFGFAFFEKEGYEADDLIATIAKKIEKSGVKVVIVTGDKDALQLVNENISVLNEHKNILYTPEKVVEKYGVLPEQLVDVFALAGDSIDNIPGVPGIGEKTAIKLIKDFNNLNNLLENVDKIKGKLSEKIKNSKDLALMSKELVVLNDSVDLDFSLDKCRIPEFKIEKIVPLLKRFEFNTLLNEIATSDQKTSQVETDYKIVLTRESLMNMKEDLISSEKISVDLETTGIDPFNCSIVGISFSNQPSKAWYIPVGHKYLNAPMQLSTDEIAPVLRSILENPDIKVCGHNIKFDFHILKKLGIKIKNIWFDTMVASYCLNPSRKSHSLKNLSIEYLNKSMATIETLIGKGKNQITMADVDINSAGKYSCQDADFTLQLACLFEPILVEKKIDKLFFDVEMPLIEVLADMEETGIKLDIEYLEKLSDEFKKEIESTESEIYQLAGENFNINSPKQLSYILFEKLKLPVIRKTKTGRSTDEDVLNVISQQHPLPSKLIRYRELQKLKSTYIDSLLNLVDRNTSRIHTSFNQTVTATGRLSSTEPNLQNIPIRTPEGKKIRRAFISEENCVLVSADYSQIDLRVLAHVSADEALKDAFFHNKDIHTSTACEIFGITPEKVTPELRRIAKTINFGIIYGMSSYGLAQELNIDQKQAQEYIDNYFKKYSGVRKWIDEILSFARKNGYVKTLLNRIRYLPEINSNNGQVRSFAERIAINTPIQGTSADIIKVAMINIYKKLNEEKLKTKMLLQVHDDLLFEVPEPEIEKVKKIIKKEMETAVNLSVPVLVDIKTGHNWRDME